MSLIHASCIGHMKALFKCLACGKTKLEWFGGSVYDFDRKLARGELICNECRCLAASHTKPAGNTGLK